MTRVGLRSSQPPDTTQKTNGNGHALLETVERPPYCWDRLPKELRTRGRFTLYREEHDRKVPYSAQNPQEKAAINKPGSWSDFETAVKMYESFPSFDGVNTVCSTEFTIVDLDECLIDGRGLSDEAQQIRDALPDTYWEVSPSTRGLHGIFRSVDEIPNIGKQDGCGLELYSHNHFMSVTGWCCSETRDIAVLTAADVERFRKKHNKEKQPLNPADKIPEGQRNTTLVRMAGSMRSRGMSLDAVEAALRKENSERCSPPLSETEIRGILKNAARWEAGGLLTQELSDVGNSERLLLYGKGNYRYVPAYKRWAVFDGARWPVENREQETIRSEAQEMFREFAIEAIAHKADDAVRNFALACRNTHRINNTMREAQPHATVEIKQLDRDPLLLNFRNGTYDARMGHLREHRREDLITAVIPHDYRPEAKCPEWEHFVSETFEGDVPTIEFVRRAFGYSLTGDTSEKVLFLAFGPTNTAKTTFLSVARRLLGDYGGRIQVNSLMVERGRPMDSNAQSDLADLRGKRFVMTSETGEGQRLREELVKVLTQGQDTYRAVRKYENPFEFKETWKIWMDANHLPVIFGTDDAIWQRLVVVSFNHVVPKKKQNKALASELITTEAEGILAWMVRGLTEWRERGLALPATMREAHQRWRKESDDLELWLAENCVRTGAGETESMRLYEDYANWRIKRGMRADSVVIFARKMRDHGFTKKELGHEKRPHWVGVGLAVKPGR